MNPRGIFCPNIDFRARGQVGKGNIGVHRHAEKRYICHACQKTFTDTKGTIFYRLRTDAAMVMLVITLLAYGCPLKAIVAAYRKSLHGQLVNEILGMGNVFQFETLSYRGLQKQYGRSVRLRAPGKFMALLKRKAERAGAAINAYDPRKAHHSQLCHHCGTVKKKPLSQCWHACSCGVVGQRDLYSAFLAMCMEGDTFNADYAKAAWSSVDTRLQAALNTAQSVNTLQLRTETESEPIACNAGPGNV
jgi:hypothetical protein